MASSNMQICVRPDKWQFNVGGRTRQRQGLDDARNGTSINRPFLLIFFSERSHHLTFATFLLINALDWPSKVANNKSIKCKCLWLRAAGDVIRQRPVLTSFNLLFFFLLFFSGYSLQTPERLDVHSINFLGQCLVDRIDLIQFATRRYSDRLSSKK